jgi:hypothetical protein
MPAYVGFLLLVHDQTVAPAAEHRAVVFKRTLASLAPFRVEALVLWEFAAW